MGISTISLVSNFAEHGKQRDLTTVSHDRKLQNRMPTSANKKLGSVAQTQLFSIFSNFYQESARRLTCPLRLRFQS